MIITLPTQLSSRESVSNEGTNARTDVTGTTGQLRERVSPEGTIETNASEQTLSPLRASVTEAPEQPKEHPKEDGMCETSAKDSRKDQDKESQETSKVVISS